MANSALGQTGFGAGAVATANLADLAVTTGKINDDAVTEPKVAAGATLAIQTAQATTSGTTKDWTIPAGTKQIIVSLHAVSTNGTAGVGVRLGTGGTPATSGYVSTALGITTAAAPFAGLYTDGFRTTGFTSAGATLYGQIILTLMDAATHVWVMSGGIAINDTTSYGESLGGTVDLTGECDILRVYSTTDTFDAGTVNVAFK